MTATNGDSVKTVEVPVEETWNLEAMFADVAEWAQEYAQIKTQMPELSQFSGRVLESAITLETFLQKSDVVRERINKLHSYAYLRYYGDTADTQAKELLEQVSTLSSEFSEVIAFFEPEILCAAPGQVQSLIESSQALEVFRYRFEEIERWRSHTRAPEIEEVLAQLEPILSAPEDIRTAIHDAEMRFSDINVGNDSRVLGHGTYDQFLTNRDRTVRERAYLEYTDGYLARLASLGETLSKQVTMSYVFSKVRNFASVFDAAMFHEAYTPDVFWSVVESCKDHRQLMQRYFKARAALLGLDTLCEYDLMAPLSAHPPHVSYARAREIIRDSLKPLGEEYQHVASEGLTTQRWVDVHPGPGKYSNPFSAGSYLTQPYILMNYSPTIAEVGTLTHELGHSMHSYLTNITQPSCYSSYSMSVAETASNLNQVLLRAYLFEQSDRELEIAALEEAMFFVHRYLFLMPNLALLEHTVHSAYAQGKPMSYREFSECTADIFTEAYGDSVSFQRDRLGSKWAQFCHLFAPFYTYQYAIGISAAMAIGERILQGEDSILEKYDAFLRAGASRSPLEIFKLVDLDFTTAQPLAAAFRVVEGYIERIERLAQ